MRLRFLFPALAVAAAGPASAGGLLVPADAKVPPLAMVRHRVHAAVDDQVAVTTVDQTFRNHTDRPLEATYLFPVPRGASVHKFAMWVDGKETAGELLDAGKARQVYTDIVRRTQDPGLLEYLGNDLLRLRVFPVPARGDQRVKVSFTAVAPMDQGVVEYTYPLKTDGPATRTLEEFAVAVSVKSRHPVHSVYSPTHAVAVRRAGSREVLVEFEKSQAVLDKDFQLFYGVGDGDVGLTQVAYRPVAADDGYFLLLVSPQDVAAKPSRVPRDLVLVLDSSGSMSDVKMAQAKKAARVLLDSLGDGDRFGLVAFSSTTRPYDDKLLPATADHLDRARKWVDDLRAGGGTAIRPALDAGLDLRTKDAGRSFTMAFFTDGVPTVDERDPDKIVKAVLARAEAASNTRIFTFGVGDDVNAVLLDRLADATRAVSTYVRPAEDIESKAAALRAKISRPAMTDVRLTATGVKLHDVYPPKLPDLFHGGQAVVIGRYTGQGPAAVKLTGMVGAEEREVVYPLTFPARTDDRRGFVEHLWARRKVGYLLDQVRAAGESKEVVDEVVALAKKYGIATPYTSYLVVPDAPPVALGVPAPPGRPVPPSAPGLGFGGGGMGPGGGGGLGGYAAGSVPGGMPAGPAPRVADFARQAAGRPDGGERAAGGVGGARGGYLDRQVADELRRLPPDQRAGGYADALKRTQDQTRALKAAEDNLRAGRVRENQEGKLGVDLAEASGQLRGQSQLNATATRQANGRTCVDVGGVWIDDRFTADAKTVVVKAQGEAYFRILAKQPGMRDVFRLGNYVVWVAPSGAAMVVDPNDGHDKLPDEEIDKLFTPAKK